MPTLRQESFAGGVLSSNLWGRMTTPRYAAGARSLLNFLVTPEGAAANRPGTRYVAPTRLNGKGRLISFNFSDQDTLLCVFTEYRIRFYTVDAATGLPGVVLATGAAAWASGTTYSAGQYVTHASKTWRALRTTVADDPETSALDWLQIDEYEVVTTYTAAQLAKIDYAQVGDVITLCHPDHTPRELTRTSASPLTFTLADVSFDVPSFPSFIDVYLQYPLPTADATYPAKQWVYYVTAICRDASGNVYETKPAALRGVLARAWSATTSYANDAYASHGGHNWKCVTGGTSYGAQPSAAWAAGTTYSENDVVAYGGSTYRALRETVGDQPDISGSDWALVDDSYWVDLGAFSSIIPEEFPVYAAKPVTLLAVVDALELIAVDPTYKLVELRIYRGRPNLFGYVGALVGGVFVDSGDTPDWARSPPKGENPFKIYDASDVLVRTENPAVVALHSQRRIFGRTNERPGFLFLSGVNAYSNFDEHELSLADDAIVREVAAWRYEEILGLLPGRVLLAFSSCTEWAVSGGDSVITPATIRFEPRTERGSTWLKPLKVGDDQALFVTAKGNVIRELAYDGNRGVYDAPDITQAAKHLFSGKTIVAWDWQEEPWSILWVVFDDGTFAAMSYAAQEVAAWTSQEMNDAVIEDVCCIREGAEDAVYFIVSRTINGVAVRYIERLDTRDVTDITEGLFLDCALTYRGAAATHFTGLEHLEGETVNALADGQVVEGLVVTDGAVDLDAELFPDGASVVHIGLPITAEFESLDCPPPDARTNVKIVKDVTVEYVGSVGGQVGQDFDRKLEEIRLREIDEDYGPVPLHVGLEKVIISSEWNRGGRIVLRQTAPLPLTILALSREVEFGGR